MDIQLEAPVVSREGADLGKISRVVFNPETGETDSLVIHKGAILGRDVAVPVDSVRVAAPTRVELDMTEEEFRARPDFVQANYAWPPESWVAPYGWPAGAVLWPAPIGAGYPFGYPASANAIPDEARERAAQEDAQEAVVGQGAEVLAASGEKVGSIQNVMVDPATNKPSRVIVKRGFLFTEDVELPGDWVASYDDNTITLNVDKATVEQLAKRQN